MNEKIITVKTGSDGSQTAYLTSGGLSPLTDATDADTTDDSALAALTDAEIEAAAMSDPDAQPVTAHDIASGAVQRLPRVKVIRRALGMTQEEFSRRFHIPVGTVRDWEQGRFEPDQASRAYLHVIAANPQAVLQAFER